MKTIIRICISGLLILNYVFAVNAQEINLTEEYKKNTIETLCQLMNDLYVHADVAQKTEIYLLKQFKEGYFDQFTNEEDFAAALTTSVQHINKDKHMRIWKKPPYEEQENSPERLIEEKIYNLYRYKEYNVGFHGVKVLDGNIGYLDLRGFAGLGEGKEVADAYMKLIANTDAVIIDLSKNGGGDPATVQYLCSYFLESNIHINSLYFREGDRTIDFHTLEEVGGKKMIDVPLFIITGKETFSGAEEFSYNMQTQKRATLIGQTTRGGANPGGTRDINENLWVFIPTGMAINPITKTNWEGVGVIPEIIVKEEESLSKTHELAKIAADEYRTQIEKKYTATYTSLLAQLNVFTKGQSENEILVALQKVSDQGLLKEWEINSLGYEHLMQYEKPNIALCIFRANTLINPESANVYDSYAEALMMQGKLEKSEKNYQKAVEIALKYNDPNLPFFEENLEKVTNLIKDKK